jgi:peptidoglycan L-alanyl-D-glutamate endopeptidase CwlK
VRVVKRAIEITEVDFTVIEGLRTRERQKELVASGASQTMNSRHLTGHAVDLAAWVGEIRWDWPLYHKIAEAMKHAAAEDGIHIEWGGDWKSFRDGPHFQLSRRNYPK